MLSLPLRLSALFLALCLSACDDAPRFTKAEPGEARSGGSATVRKTDQNAFSLPSANLAPSRRVDFSVGNSFFRNPWVIAPSTTTARDGLGPLFNTNACQNCHIKDGRGATGPGFAGFGFGKTRGVIAGTQAQGQKQCGQAKRQRGHQTSCKTSKTRAQSLTGQWRLNKRNYRLVDVEQGFSKLSSLLLIQHRPMWERCSDQ